MAERVSALDASFVYMESPTTPMHVGTVAICQPGPDGLDHERLVRLIRSRLAYVPRYRQRLKHVPLGLARPVWVDDLHFDVTYHVRRSALPKPGSREQLDELVGRLMGRPLDLTRPLWELYLIEGLADGSIAIVAKSHESMIDGFAAMDLLQVILDPEPGGAAATPDVWRPAPEPTGAELVSEALTQTFTSPVELVQSVVNTAGEALASVGGVAGAVRDGVRAMLKMARPPVSCPLNVPIGEHRRFATVDLDLAEVKEIRAKHGGTVNDVVLAIIAGAMREWLQSRAMPPAAGRIMRVVVPISTAPQGDGEHAASVSAFLVDLPVGEPDPLMRLRHVTFQTAQWREHAALLGADALVNIAGFGPATMHALGARLASTLSNRLYNLAVTNVPGPQEARFIGGSRLIASYPAVPLAAGQALSIGITSYEGRLFVGLLGDRDAMSDLPMVVECIRSSINELSAGRARTETHLRAVPEA